MVEGPARRFLLAAVASLTAILAACPASAGPPFLTDDPQPTDAGHWEIYNFIGGAREPDGLDGEAGVDLNYGAAKNLQLTAVLPLAFHEPRGYGTRRLSAGGGVIELAAKYKFAHQAEGSGLPDLSLFPRLFVPTDRSFGPSRVNLLLPVWAQKDLGPWSAFGGGGFQINPGPGQRNFWQGGLAVARTVTPRLSIGIEAFGQTRDADDGGGFTALNLGATYALVEHWSLLASAGPTRQQGGGHGQVFYLSLKADY